MLAPNSNLEDVLFLLRNDFSIDLLCLFGSCRQLLPLTSRALVSQYPLQTGSIRTLNFQFNAPYPWIHILFHGIFFSVLHFAFPFVVIIFSCLQLLFGSFNVPCSDCLSTVTHVIQLIVESITIATLITTPLDCTFIVDCCIYLRNIELFTVPIV